MLKGFTKNGELINVLVSDEGKLLVEGAGESSGKETTLNASIETVGIEPTVLNISKKVTSIDIANYSNTADITIGIGRKSFVIGNNIATTIAINTEIINIVLSSTENDSKVQIIIKGVE